MSAFIPDVPHVPADSALPLTGERTIPGLDVENYWFRRHEVVYQQLARRCAGRDVLEAGCGEGYGADLIAGVARQVTAVDYDEATVGTCAGALSAGAGDPRQPRRPPAARPVGRCRGQLPKSSSTCGISHSSSASAHGSCVHPGC